MKNNDTVAWVGRRGANKGEAGESAVSRPLIANR